MSEFERPSYVSETGKLSKNDLESVIRSTKDTIEAMERQTSSAPKASIPAIEAQIRATRDKLKKLQEESDGLGV